MSKDLWLEEPTQVFEAIPPGIWYSFADGLMNFSSHFFRLSSWTKLCDQISTNYGVQSADFRGLSITHLVFFIQTM